jgi:nucleoside-diphosphate-sugar epimerase
MPASPRTGRRALVVFGGTGFVGTAVLAEALLQDEELQIFAISRTGVAPAWLSDEPFYQTPRLGFL